MWTRNRNKTAWIAGNSKERLTGWLVVEFGSLGRVGKRPLKPSPLQFVNSIRRGVGLQNNDRLCYWTIVVMVWSYIFGLINILSILLNWASMGRPTVSQKGRCILFPLSEELPAVLTSLSFGDNRFGNVFRSPYC